MRPRKPTNGDKNRDISEIVKVIFRKSNYPIRYFNMLDAAGDIKNEASGA